LKRLLESERFGVLIGTKSLLTITFAICGHHLCVQILEEKKKFLRGKENKHVSFVNHHLFASPGNYHYRHTKQYAFGFQIFYLEFSDIYYSLDFFFFSDWWSHCGGFGLTKAGDEIPSWKEPEPGDREIERRESTIGEKTCRRVSERIALP